MKENAGFQGQNGFGIFLAFSMAVMSIWAVGSSRAEGWLVDPPKTMIPFEVVTPDTMIDIFTTKDAFQFARCFDVAVAAYDSAWGKACAAIGKGPDCDLPYSAGKALQDQEGNSVDGCNGK